MIHKVSRCIIKQITRMACVIYPNKKELSSKLKVIVVSCPLKKIERKMIIKTYIYIYI